MIDLNLSTGGANKDDLIEAGQAGIGAVSDSDPVPWDHSWQVRFEDWQTDSKPLTPITLLFCPQPSVVGRSLECQIIYQLGAISKRPNAGVYLLGRTSNANGWMLPSTSNDYQTNCQLISSLGLGDFPAIILGLNTSEIIFMPHGINADDSGLVISIGDKGSPFDDSVLTFELNHFAENNLAHSDLKKDLWEDASKHWPKEQAERIIQKFLLISLRQAFKKHEILSETNVVAGRVDIAVLPGSSKQSGRSVLELKALRGFGSTGTKVTSTTLIQHIKDGVEQAYTYFKSATHKYVCTYDMRLKKDNSIFTEPEELAASLDVKIRNFEVFASSKEARKSLVASALSQDQ
jgi:hypothetical protein